MTATACVTVSISRTKGSAPREQGAVMHVFAHGQNGSIGGGALEYSATQIARDILAGKASDQSRDFPLGPALGQCCGGAVTLDFRSGHGTAPAPQTDLWIWGAGHVGRAIASTLAPLDAFNITLIDTQAARLPDPLPPQVTPLIAQDPTRLIPHAPPNAAHLILTYSHDIDFALCHGLLTHGARQIGLIGSATKWARFQRRLDALGHSSEEIARIRCPIGDPSLGKHPQAIAIGVAAVMIAQNDTTTREHLA